MAVKEKEGRKRYIAFRIEYKNPNDRFDVDRNVFIRSVKGVSRNMGERVYEEVEPWLTKFDGTSGILRCRHNRKEDAIALLKRMRWMGPPDARMVIRIETFGTSGTIKCCIKKFLKGVEF